MTLMELDDLLIIVKVIIQETIRFANPILAINRVTTKRKRVSHPIGKVKGKVGQLDQNSKKEFQAEIVPTTDPNEVVCF